MSKKQSKKRFKMTCPTCGNIIRYTTSKSKALNTHYKRMHPVVQVRDTGHRIFKYLKDYQRFPQYKLREQTRGMDIPKIGLTRSEIKTLAKLKQPRRKQGLGNTEARQKVKEHFNLKPRKQKQRKK